MDWTQLATCILLLTASAALLLLALSVWLGVRAYCGKLQAEERLAQTARAEADVRLVQSFTDLVLLAAGTGRYGISGELLTALLESGVIGEDDFDPDDPTPLHTKVARLAMMPTSSGGPTASLFAAQAIAALAGRHDLLRDLGIRALELERIREISPERIRDLLQVLQRPT